MGYLLYNNSNPELKSYPPQTPERPFPEVMLLLQQQPKLLPIFSSFSFLISPFINPVFQILLKSYSCSLIFPTSLFFFSPSLSFFCYILNVIIIIHYTMLFFIIQVFFPVFMTKRLLIRQKKRHEKEPDSSSYLSFRYFLFFSFLCLAFIKQLPVLAGYRKLLKYE